MHQLQIRPLQECIAPPSRPFLSSSGPRTAATGRPSKRSSPAAARIASPPCRFWAKQLDPMNRTRHQKKKYRRGRLCLCLISCFIYRKELKKKIANVFFSFFELKRLVRLMDCGYGRLDDTTHSLDRVVRKAPLGAHPPLQYKTRGGGGGGGPADPR